MASLQEIRQQYPQYGDMSDAALADAFHKKYYADMPQAEFDAKIGFQRMGTVEDVARSAATGVGEGATQSVGLLGDLYSLGDVVREWTGAPPLPKPKGGVAGAVADVLPDITPPTTAAIEQAISFDKMKHEPQTTAGEFTRTAASFAGPAAAAGIGRGLVKSAVKYGVVPGVASEAAGQATEGTDMESLARVVGALTGGGVSAVLSRPTTAASVLKRYMPEGVTNNDIIKADSLMLQARGSGVPLTWPEALHKVTDGRVDITGLQRIVEQSPGGQPVMSAAMAPRPAQTAKAMTGAMDDLTYGARMVDPRQAGLGIQNAADEGLTDIRQRINAIAEPYYNAAKGTRIDPAAFARLQVHPIYQQALRRVRTDPVHSLFVQGLPDDSVGVQNEIKKFLDRRASKLTEAGDNQGSAAYGGVGRGARDAAKTASPDYERALGLEADLRQRFLNPTEAGPVGALSKTDDILAQGRAVLASNAAEGSDDAVRETIRLLTRRNPDQAFQLVRTHLQSQFDEAAQNLIAGGNQWGGAKFAAAIRGNGQQAKNLEAAVRALPDGDIRWEGLNAFLEVLEATGRRQRPGSLTAFNANALDDMKRGGLPVETLRSVRSLGNRLFDYYEEFKLGKNSADLARMITDPGSAKLLRDLAAARTPGGRQAFAGFLVSYYASQGLNKPSESVPAQMQSNGGR